MIKNIINFAFIVCVSNSSIYSMRCIPQEEASHKLEENNQAYLNISKYLSENFSFQERLYAAIQCNYIDWLKENIISYKSHINEILLNNESPIDFAKRINNEKAIEILKNLKI